MPSDISEGIFLNHTTMNRKQFLESMGLSLIGSSLYSQIEHPTSHTLRPMSNNHLDWKSIRKQFPLNKNYTYLNNGTMGLTPKPVLDTLNASFLSVARKGRYPQDYISLPKALARVMDAGTEDNIAITKNVTEGINIAAWAQNLKEGDEVLMTTHEHIGGCGVWLYRARYEGIKIKTFPLGSTAEMTLHHLKKALTDKTRVIAVPHIPCTIGQVLPVKEICDMARQRGITSIIDGAHPLGMLRLRIQDINPDYYVGCLHKWLLAPLGMGFIYIKSDRIPNTPIRNVGAYSLAKFDMTVENPQAHDDEIENGAGRYSSGTFCGPLYDASLKAIEWYESIGIDRIEKRVKELSLYTQNMLRSFSKDIEVLSPIEEVSRGGQTTFRYRNKDNQEFVSKIDSIKLRHVHEANLDAIRVSTHYYNSEKEIDLLMSYIEKYLKA